MLNDLTMDELKTLISDLIDARLGQQITLEPHPGSSRILRVTGIERSGRTQAEVHASIRQNRWTPPPGAPSSLELVREDRDR